MKTICIDAGNHFIKIACMEGSVIRSVDTFPAGDPNIETYFASLPQVDACIISNVGATDRKMTDILSQKASHFMELTEKTPVPINNLYETPQTLGKDRLAAVVGAYSLFPEKNILVVDAGTALTIDFIDRERNYHGGNISPGLTMRFQALHHDTKRLPLLTPTNDYELIGKTTASAIISGVQNGIIFEINAYIHHFIKKFPDLITILTGGDGFFLENKMENIIFAEPNLVFIGLKKIIEFNTSRNIK